MSSYLTKIGGFFSLFHKSARAYSSRTIDGIPYYGFTYYPRHEDFKDPPYNPSKLFVVKIIKKNVACKKDEKEILKQFQLKGRYMNRKKAVIVKNVPEVNALLWKVKHLIEIKPISWEGELPEDSLGTFLRDSGQLVISPKLKYTSDVLEKTEDYENCKHRFKQQYHKKYLLQKWTNGHYDED